MGLIQVNRGPDYFKIPLMKDSVMAEILTLQTSTLVMSVPRNFTFFGSILIEMLQKVPLDYAIVREFGSYPIQLFD